MKKFNIKYEILKGLSKGLTQKEIAELLQRKGITPCSYSSVDKHIKKMVIEMKCKTTFQLVYKVGVMGLLDHEDTLTALFD